MSTIAAGTTSGTALVSTGNTDGTLQLQVNGTTPALTLNTSGAVGVGSTPGYGTSGQVLTSGGSGAAPSWSTPSGLAAATQAEMEAASSNTVAATPSNTKWHPGVAKAWLKCNGTGTAINTSYNITSITDTGTGIVTVTIATDFSSADYCVSGTAQGSSSGAPGMKYIHISSQAAGSFVGTSGADPSSSGPSDPESYYFACFGDQ